MRICAVFFDVGETLIDETRVWGLLADWLGIPRLTVFGILGGLAAQGRNHRDIVDILRPDLGWKGVVAGFGEGNGDRLLPEDLYPDAVACLEQLKKLGYFVGIVGNQPAEREDELRAMNLPADLIATSGGWGVKKPDQAFFERIPTECGFKPSEIAYVGDRVDNDVYPASRAGMVPIHLVRGPWGYLQRDWPQARLARRRLGSLAELPQALGQL